MLYQMNINTSNVNRATISLIINIVEKYHYNLQILYYHLLIFFFLNFVGLSIVPKWSNVVTHVVCSTDKAGLAKRTFKLLKGTL